MKQKTVDIKLSADADTTIVTCCNAVGSRVAKYQLPGCGDFSVLGVPVVVKMPLDVVKSIIRGRGARYTTTAA